MSFYKGEAEYINDIRAESGELFGVFVTTTVANGTIKHVDASKALAIPDVVAFVTARDIPGQNNYTPFFNYPEEVSFCSKFLFCTKFKHDRKLRILYCRYLYRKEFSITDSLLVY